MGNAESSRMAISAMSHMIKITKAQLLALRDQCISDSEDDASTSSGYRLSRTTFADAMKKLNVDPEPDCQVFEKLFTMFDSNGKGSLDPVSGAWEVGVTINGHFFLVG